MYISGPISAHILDFNGKRVYLFGDRHYSRGSACGLIDGQRPTRVSPFTFKLIEGSQQHFTIEALLLKVDEHYRAMGDQCEFYIETRPSLDDVRARDVMDKRFIIEAEMRKEGLVTPADVTAKYKDNLKDDPIYRGGHLDMLHYCLFNRRYNESPGVTMIPCDPRTAVINGKLVSLSVGMMVADLASMHIKEMFTLGAFDKVKSAIDDDVAILDLIHDRFEELVLPTFFERDIGREFDERLLKSLPQQKLSTDLFRLLIDTRRSYLEDPAIAARASTSLAFEELLMHDPGVASTLESTAGTLASSYMEDSYELMRSDLQEHLDKGVPLDDRKMLSEYVNDTCRKIVRVAGTSSAPVELDIFTVTRIANSEVGTCIVFAGNAHIQGILTMLTTLGAEVLYTQESGSSRCVQIPWEYSPLE